MRILDSINAIFCLPKQETIEVTPNLFHLYVRDNDLQAVRQLCESVDDWTELPYPNFSPLFDAVVNNHIEMARYLLQQGAKEEKHLRRHVPSKKMLQLLQSYHGQSR